MNPDAEHHFHSLDQAVLDGQAVYNKYLLAVYNVTVFRINYPLFWRCPVSSVQRLYNASVGAEHLELGVGTGYLPAHSTFPVPAPRITLLDLNPTTLAVATKRLAKYRTARVRANVLEPLPVPKSAFDSVGLNFLLHCLPGTLREKGVVLAHAAAAARPGGVVFGSTILSSGVPVSVPARMMMRVLNATGVFHNDRDDLGDLRSQLDRHFASHQLIVRGCVALFRARTIR